MSIVKSVSVACNPGISNACCRSATLPIVGPGDVTRKEFGSRRQKDGPRSVAGSKQGSCGDGGGQGDRQPDAADAYPERPTRLTKEPGYGKGNSCNHDTADGYSGQNHLSDGMARRDLYQPVDRGFERDVRKRLDYWAKLRAARSDQPVPCPPPTSMHLKVKS